MGYRNSIRAVARGVTGQINSAALVIADHPIALQFRDLQTLLEIGDTKLDDCLPRASRANAPISN